MVNTKAIMIYVVLLVIVAIIAFFILPSAPAKTTTAVTTFPSNSQKTTAPPQTTIGSITTTAGFSSSCISANQTVPIYNGNFSTGTFAGWSTTGLGFGSAPRNKTYYNDKLAYYGSPWSGFNGVFFASNFQGGVQVVGGNLTSNTFVVSEPFLNFKIISPRSQLIFVQVLRNGTPAITTYFNTYSKTSASNLNSSSTFVNASINIIPLLCDNIQIKVSAGTQTSTSGSANTNYIAVTGFFLGKKPYQDAVLPYNQTINLTS
ncbi:MAG: hypothetical protein ACYCO0_01235 [Candidatus Micrarchaeaceae archaeon]